MTGFNWELLRSKNTIGCNSAFIHGSHICNVCFFSDHDWFYKFEDELEAYTGLLVTHNEELLYQGPKYLCRMRRTDQGLHQGDTLGFGGNSGVGAINLALSFGANRVFLLGFDCKTNDISRPNWHTRQVDKLDLEVYGKFLEGFYYVACDLPRVFPGCEIINLNQDSAIPYFPKANLTDFL